MAATPMAVDSPVSGGPVIAETAAEPELPKAAVQRLVRAKVTQMFEAAHKGTGDKKLPSIQLHKDALLALNESGRVFINYLASYANDFAKENKRKTISPDDVFKALEELEFNELVQPLTQYLEGHRSKAKEKASGKKSGSSTAKKRKAAAAAGEEEGEEDPAAEQQQAAEQPQGEGEAADPEPQAAE